MNKQQFITKSNRLIEAHYRLSLQEQRVLLLAISQIERDAPVTDETLYLVTAADFAGMTGSVIDGTYIELEAVVSRLFDREVSLLCDASKGKRRRMRTRWVQTVEYRAAEGTVALRFSKDILPFLTELKREFTSFPLADIGQLRSANAIRLYELLAQWKAASVREIGVAELRKILSLEGKYPNIRDLKRRVIDPAVKQLNEHSPIWVKYDQRKQGRMVAALIFRFGEKPRKTSSPAPEQPKRSRLTKAYIEAHARPGESWDDAKARLGCAS